MDIPTPSHDYSQIPHVPPAAYVSIVSEQQQRLPECIKKAAQKFQLPELLLKAIRDVEGGKIGMAKRNRNGSFDLGPYQINTIWLAELKNDYPWLNWQTVAHDACVNSFIAAKILRTHIDKTPNDLWAAVGNYHYHHKASLTRHHKYAIKVMRRYMALLKQKITRNN